MSSPQTAAPAFTSIGVLVADDDPAILRLLELGLRLHGFVVWSAASGQQALDLFRLHAARIQLALIDVQMSGFDGLQTLSALRALRPDLSCCFMSGGGGAHTDQELLGLGAARVFHKPFTFAELLEFLSQFARHTERRTEPRLAGPHAGVVLGGEPARMRDRSAGGLGLWMPRPVAVGSVLLIQFEGQSNPQHSVEVRHCRLDAGGWALGCRFVSELRPVG